MGLLRNALTYYSKKFELATVEADHKIHSLQSLENPATPLSSWGDDVVGSNVVANEATSFSIGAYFSSIKVISETMAQMDLEVIEKIGKYSKANTSHKNYWLLHAEPSPLYNRFEWIQSMFVWALSWGNGYSKIVRDRFANAIELKLLPSNEVIPKVTERGKLYYEWQHDGGIEIIMADDMIHLKNMGTNGLVGLSTAMIHRETLTSSLAKIQQEKSFYENGAKASGVLMTPGTMGTNERKNLTDSFQKATEGAANRFKTIILEEGVKYQQLTIPQNDAQFLESKKFDQTEIAGWFRVPPHMIGNLQDANYSNMEAQDRSFAKNCIVPWAIRFQQELDRKLFFEGERGKFQTQFNLDDLIKGDIKTRYEVYNAAVNSGILKPTEPREAEGWPMEGTEEIDKFFMNSTMKAVQEILNPIDTENQPIPDEDQTN
jgi:HK97 family phage portal protein